MCFGDLFQPSNGSRAPFFSLIYTKLIRKKFPDSSLVTLVNGSFKQSQASLVVYFHTYRDLVPQILCKCHAYKHKNVCTDTLECTYIKYILEFSTKNFCLEESAHTKTLCAHTDSAIKIQLKFYEYFHLRYTEVIKHKI